MAGDLASAISDAIPFFVIFGVLVLLVIFLYMCVQQVACFAYLSCFEAAPKKNRTEDSSSDEEIATSSDESGRPLIEDLSTASLAGHSIQVEPSTSTPARTSDSQKAISVDISPPEPELAKLRLSLTYDVAQSLLKVYLINAQMVDSTLMQAKRAEVHMIDMPRSRTRHRTKRKRSDLRGGFVIQQIFTFKSINPDVLFETSIRCRLYVTISGRSFLVCQGTISLGAMGLSGLMSRSGEPYWLPMYRKPTQEPTTTAVSPATTNESIEDGEKPSLEVTLSYNKFTGRLIVIPKQASGLRAHGSNKPPTTFARMILMDPDGITQLDTHETSAIPSSHRPNYATINKRGFAFEVISFQIRSVALIVNIYHKSFRRKESLGWLSFDLNTPFDSVREHWECILPGTNREFTHVHLLQPPVGVKGST